LDLTVTSSVDLLPRSPSAADWPALPSDAWSGSIATLHRWTQVVGKIRMCLAPWQNHSWSVPLYVTASGLGTSLVPYGGAGVELDFDLLRHRFGLRATTGASVDFALEDGLSVADFHARVLGEMRGLGMPVEIDPMPSEIADAVPFPEDHEHATYDPAHITALWRALVQAERVMAHFRAGYLGKASPVNFFWGSFDLAASRFSGRTAPPHPGGLPNFPLDVAREAYSHELTAVGFWPGNEAAPEPIFYAYAYPTPEGYAGAPVQPDGAAWFEPLGEFVLPYAAVRSAADPDADLLAFFESTHAAAADLGAWERSELECAAPHGAEWWRSRGRG
jgi:hypothetical protein